jgi:signal transduction histidine kinase
MLALPVSRRVLVVGGTRENRAETLDSLRTAFFIGGPLALLLAALGGYVLAGFALRPVAEGITRERRFVADASHELRTPLALLKTELELALRRARTPEELERALRSASAETDRLGRIADDLLLLARSDSGRLPLRLEPVDVDDLLGVVAGRFRSRAETERRTLVVDAGRAGVLIADRLRLEQALENMLDNAFMHGAGDVRLAAVAQHGTVELHVTDDGGGFAADFVEHAFDRFSRADEARTRGGSGLGLAIVDTVARAHGGTAHAASRDRGADVWMTLNVNSTVAEPYSARAHVPAS